MFINATTRPANFSVFNTDNYMLARTSTFGKMGVQTFFRSLDPLANQFWSPLLLSRRRPCAQYEAECLARGFAHEISLFAEAMLSNVFPREPCRGGSHTFFIRPPRLRMLDAPLQLYKVRVCRLLKRAKSLYGI